MELLLVDEAWGGLRDKETETSSVSRFLLLSEKEFTPEKLRIRKIKDQKKV
jgi:hypothetical protein